MNGPTNPNQMCATPDGRAQKPRKKGSRTQRQMTCGCSSPACRSASATRIQRGPAKACVFSAAGPELLHGHQEDRAVGVVNQPVGDTTHEQAGDASTAVSCQHDKICVLGEAGLNDGLCRS